MGAGRGHHPTSRTGTQSSSRCNKPSPMPTRQSLLAALDAIQTNTHSKHALLANLQSRAIKVPLLVLYTSGSNTDPHFILACCHHPVSMCTVLPVFKQPNGLSAPAQPPPPPFLLAPDYSLYTTASFFLSDSWIPGALSGLTFASLFEFQFHPFLSRCWQTGKFQLSFFQYHLKRALITCWRTRWRFSGVQKKQTSHIFSLVQTIIPKLEMFFFLPQVLIIYFNYGRADHNTGLRVWCFIFLFLSLDEENLPQS